MENNGDESETRRPSWQEYKAFKKPLRLLDHPDLWKKAGLNEDLIMNSERLRKMMGQPQNNVVTSLPNASDVVRHFYCAGCTEIPFPWAPNPSVSLHDEEPSKSVFLCENGHALCRTCYQSYERCVFSNSDYIYIFKSCNSEESSLGRHLAQSVPGSMGMWGLTRLCLAESSPFKCMFLTEMIRAAEFSCKYYYNWCAFRGSDTHLHTHETLCPHAVLYDETKNMAECSLQVQEDRNSDIDDDTDIVGIDVSALQASVRRKVQSILNEKNYRLDLTKLPEHFKI